MAHPFKNHYCIPKTRQYRQRNIKNACLKLHRNTAAACVTASRRRSSPEKDINRLEFPGKELRSHIT